MKAGFGMGHHARMQITFCPRVDRDMSASAENPDPMFQMQKQRLGLVLRLTQENAMVLTLQHRVAGKEIEVLVTQRNSRTDFRDSTPLPDDLAQVLREQTQLQELLEHHERTAADLDAALRQIDIDIAAMCQS
jgi:hypothetical protein